MENDVFLVTLLSKRTLFAFDVSFIFLLSYTFGHYTCVTMKLDSCISCFWSVYAYSVTVSKAEMLESERPMTHRFKS